MRMPWLHTFKAVGDEPSEKGKVKVKARIVDGLGGFPTPLYWRGLSEPGHDKVEQDVAAGHGDREAMEDSGWGRQTAFLQAKPPERLHLLYVKPLPGHDQMIDFLGSARPDFSAERMVR